MQPVAIPVFGLAMITLPMALISLQVFLHRRSLKLHLYLALTCLGIAIYDLMCVGLYQAADLATGAAWQRAQMVTLALVVPVATRFIVLYTRFDWPWLTRTVTVTGLVVAAVGLVERHGLLLALEPSVKHLDLPLFGPVTYHEHAAGPLFLWFTIVVVVALVFFVRAGIAMLRTGDHRHAVPFLVAAGLFVVTIMSDSLVTSGLYVAPYLMEYGFSALIVLTGLLLTDEFLRAAALEEALQQSRRLESLGRLAGGVAHDLNNYLTPVMGFSELVLQELDPQSQAYEDLKRVQTGTMKSAALTQQLLAFGRRLVLEPTVTSIDAVVREAQPLLARLLGDRIQLELALDADRATVRVDIGQIEQLILNLAANARDAMPDGGRLRIASVARDQAVLLEIEDDGCGMSAELLERVFEPFFTTKAPGKGTGLGLAQVHGIVEQHRGEVEVRSEVGQGTRVRLSLPRCASPAVAEPAGV
jgi:signal transduction histidine kinase